jgi:predicted Zn-dependent peptidase
VTFAVHEDCLDNGVRIVTVPRPGLSRGHVCVQLRGGPVHEDDGTWGMSHLVEHMVFRGTDVHRDVAALALGADDFGGDVGAATWRDRVAFDTRVDPERIHDAFDLLASMIAAPRFAQLAVERAIVEEEISDLFDDDGNDIDPENAVFAHLFAGHVLARPIEGRPELLRRYDKRAVRAFHRLSYGGQNVVVSVAGPVSRRSVLAAARSAFARVPPGPVPQRGRSPPPTARARGRVHVVKSESAQTSVRLCGPMPGFMAPAAASAHMLARLLDDGPASRLQARVVDRDGLAYSVWAMADLYEDRGCLEIGGNVRPEHAADLVDALVRELASIARRPPSVDELARVCARAARDALDALDDPALLAESAGKGVLFLHPWRPARELRALRAVAPADVQRLARIAAAGAHLVLSGTVFRSAASRARGAWARLSG